MSERLVEPEWRRKLWREIADPWDVLVIGGGITGAGILRVATDLGLKVLLLERNDFAWGTSGRSGKLVHGGLRYLKQGHINVIRDSVRERERLLREAPGLVEPVNFMLPVYEGQGGLRLAYRAGLWVYDLLAGRKSFQCLNRGDLLARVPEADRPGLREGFFYQDAGTDDARLVLRLILESVEDGGRALNYAGVEELLFSGGGSRVSGVVAGNRLTGETARITARVVINATGAWADNLRLRLGRSPFIRPLRGSHIIFPKARLPLKQGVNFFHPADGRPLYAFPWEGATLLGTTDLDQHGGLTEEPGITSGEKEYLLEAAGKTFPSLKLQGQDILSTFAGVRPVVGSGKKDPSKESRDMVVKDEGGLLTVTGGKLTTFRLLAIKALSVVADKLSIRRSELGKRRIYRQSLLNEYYGDNQILRRLAGRYGDGSRGLLTEVADGEGREIPGTVYFWAELKHVAKYEMAVHLDDLLLRRLRLGLVLPSGGAEFVGRIKDTVCPAMGWNESRWQEEWDNYLAVWRRAYSPDVGGADC